MKFTLAATLILLTFCGHAQTAKKDSIVLAHIKGERITKVVSKYDRKNLISVGLQTQTDSTASIYFQNFDYDGFPLTDTAKIVRVVIPQFKSFDFDLAIDTLGNSIIVWSQYDIVSMKYKIMSCVLDQYGHVKKEPSMVATSMNHFVRTSINAHGQFLISWYEYMNSDVYLKIQLFDKNYSLDGALLSVYYAGNIEPHSYPVELTESNQLAISWYLDHGNRTGSHIKLLNKQGSVINYPDEDYGYQEYYKQSFDMSFSYRQTFASFSIFTEAYLKKGTYVAIPSRFNPEQNQNIIGVDTQTSKITQVVQDKKGSAFLGWLTDSGEIKGQFFQNSGQSVNTPTVLWQNGNGLTVETMDVLLNDNNEATILYAANGSNEATLILQRVSDKLMQETIEIIAPQSEYKKISSKILTGSKTHVVLWHHVEDYQSALFAQIYDKQFKKIGSLINVTGYKSHELLSSKYFEADAAIDSIGNFMITWSEYKIKDVFAKKYDASGTIVKDKFSVNQAYDDEYKVPKIGANQKGDFIIVWNKGYGQLKARIFKKDIDGDEKVIKECCLPQFDGTIFSRAVVSMNNSGKFVYALRSGYYNLTFFIFNQNMELIKDATSSNILSSSSEFDLQLSEQDKIVAAWTKAGLENFVSVQQYNGLGEKIGDPYTIDNSIETSRRPGVSVNRAGDYCVLYNHQFPTTANVQKFKQDGQKDGDVFRLNTFLTTFEADVTYYDDEITASWTSIAYIVSSPGGMNSSDVILKGVYDEDSSETYNYRTATIYEGDSLEFGLHYLKKAGRYSHTFNTGTGNDSTVVLTLKVLVKDPVTNVEEKENIVFSIFPNPSHDRVFIEGEEKVLSLEITDALGRHYASRFDGSEMSLEGLPQGLYYISIITPKGGVYYKIIKK